MVYFTWGDAKIAGAVEGECEWYEGLLMFITYCCYVIYMGFNEKIMQTFCPRDDDDFQEEIEFFSECVVTGIPTRYCKDTSPLMKELNRNIFTHQSWDISCHPSMIMIKLKEEHRVDETAVLLEKDLRHFLEWEDFSDDITVLALDKVTKITQKEEEDEGEMIREKLQAKDEEEEDAEDEEGICWAVDAVSDFVTGAWNVAFAITIHNCNVEECDAKIELFDERIQDLSREYTQKETVDAWADGEQQKLEDEIKETEAKRQEEIADRTKREDLYMWAFVESILWIGLISFIMVWFASKLGCLLNIPPVIMGVTVLAAGTSVPDAFASIAAAQQGLGDMAVANAIGSNVFDILIGLGIPWFAYGLIEPYEIDTDGVIIQIGILFFSVFFVVGSFIATGWILNKKLGYVLIMGYVAFALYSVVDSYVNPKDSSD
eukprot:UN33960